MKRLTLILAAFAAALAIVIPAWAATSPTYTVTKVADSQTVEPADNIGYTLTAAVAGSTAAYTFQDALPGGYAWYLDSGDARCFINNSFVFCANVGVEAPLRLHVTGVPFTVHDCGDITNVASLRLAGVEVASASAVIHVNCPASLAITKSFSADTVPLYGLQTALITVANSGDGAAGAFDIADPLPEPGINWFISNQSGVVCSITSSVLTCHGEALAGKTAAAVAVYGSPTVCGSFLNYSAAVTSGGVLKLAPQVGFSVPCPVTPTPTPSPTVVAPTATATPPPTATPAPTKVAPGPPNTGDSPLARAPARESTMPAKVGAAVIVLISVPLLIITQRRKRRL